MHEGQKIIPAKVESDTARGSDVACGGGGSGGGDGGGGEGGGGGVRLKTVQVHGRVVPLET